MQRPHHLARLPIPTCSHTDLPTPAPLPISAGAPCILPPFAYRCPLILPTQLGERSSKKPLLTVGVSGTFLIVVLATGYHNHLWISLPPLQTVGNWRQV